MVQPANPVIVRIVLLEILGDLARLLELLINDSILVLCGTRTSITIAVSVFEVCRMIRITLDVCYV